MNILLSTGGVKPEVPSQREKPQVIFFSTLGDYRASSRVIRMDSAPGQAWSFCEGSVGALAAPGLGGRVLAHSLSPEGQPWVSCQKCGQSSGPGVPKAKMTHHGKTKPNPKSDRIIVFQT